MKRKFIIAFLLFNTLLYSGCEMSNLNNTKSPTKLTTSNIKQLVGITYSDVEKIYGSPEMSTYYINIKDLSCINKDYISLRDFNHYSIIKAYYNINNNDSYVILWYKNNKVINSSFDENDIINKDYLDENINNFDIKIDYNKNSSYLNKSLTSEKYKYYIGRNIKQFNNKYNLLCPKIIVNLLNDNKVLYFYDIKDKNNEYINNNSLFVICHNNIITEINIIKSSKICESIIDYFK